MMGEMSSIKEQFDALEAKLNARVDFIQRSIKQRFGKLNARMKRAEQKPLVAQGK